MAIVDSAKGNYRQRIYENYASNFQDAVAVFDEEQAKRWALAYRYYYRGWIPANPSAAIVDLACGAGKSLYLFKGLGFKDVTGVDISPEQVALARQVVDSVKLQNVLDFLKENPGRFDLITGLDIVEHFHKPEVLDFLEGCNYALKPAGRLILQTPNADSPWGTVHRYNDFTHEVGFNSNALGRLLKLLGFTSVEAREQGPIPFGYSASSTVRSAMWGSIRVALKVWNYAEIGSPGSGIFTRNFLISGRKR